MVWAFATFILASLLAVASPGPAFIAISHIALNRSKHEAMAFAFGLAVTATLWCGLALFGLTAIFAIVPWLYGTMKLLGGAYLIWLAVKIWRGAKAPLPTSAPKPRHGLLAFFSGCAVNMTNPKSVLFAGAIMLTIFPADMSLQLKLLVLAVLLVIEFGFYNALVFWLSRPKTRNAYLNLKCWIDRSAAALLGALGLKLLFSKC